MLKRKTILFVLSIVCGFQMTTPSVVWAIKDQCITVIEDLAAEADQCEFDTADCLKRVLANDEKATEEMYHYLRPLVLKIVHSRLPKRTSPEDLVQTTFMKVFAKLNTYSGKAPLEAWVSRIAVNSSFNAIRSEGSRPELRWADMSEDQERHILDLHAMSASSNFGPSPESGDLLNLLLGQLKSKDKKLIDLVDLQGHSYEEAAKIMGMSLANVKIRVFRARNKLKIFYRELLNSEHKSQDSSDTP
ncbi:MAG: polymerase subunit sigma-24 [Bacteriovoracaceae bacterium]|nr:polymerase subunit sigma-24 [Bacteriovoracaceae bacterium]